MRDWIWYTILYNIPWWAYVWAALLAIIVFGMWARNVGGTKNALVLMGGALVALTAGALTLRGRQQGARDQQKKDQRDADKTLDEANRARADARANNDNLGRLRDDDGFRRDD